jgi:hypothetical protein
MAAAPRFTEAVADATAQRIVFGKSCPRFNMVMMTIAFFVGLQFGGVWMIVLPLGQRIGGLILLGALSFLASGAITAGAVPVIFGVGLGAWFLFCLLAYAVVAMLFNTEGRQTLAGIVFVIGLGAFFVLFSLPVMQAEWDRRDKAYAVCMADPARLPNVPPSLGDNFWKYSDGTFMGKESWCKYQAKTMDYQVKIGLRQPGNIW